MTLDDIIYPFHISLITLLNGAECLCTYNYYFSGVKFQVRLGLIVVPVTDRNTA
jgi:hypothetical protein